MAAAFVGSVLDHGVLLATALAHGWAAGWKSRAERDGERKSGNWSAAADDMM